MYHGSVDVEAFNSSLPHFHIRSARLHRSSLVNAEFRSEDPRFASRDVPPRSLPSGSFSDATNYLSYYYQNTILFEALAPLHCPYLRESHTYSRLFATNDRSSPSHIALYGLIEYAVCAPDLVPPDRRAVRA